MKILDWFNIIGGTIGVAAFIWAWILNSQQRKINRLTLNEKEDAALKQKQAQIRAMTYKYNSSYWKVKVWNDGICAAKNITFISEDIEKEEIGIYLIVENGLLPFPLLNSGEGFEMTAQIESNAPPTPKITFVWDDESGKKRSREQVLLF